MSNLKHIFKENVFIKAEITETSACAPIHALEPELALPQSWRVPGKGIHFLLFTMPEYFIAPGWSSEGVCV